MEKDTLKEITPKQVLEMRNQIICTYYEDNKVCSVCIDIKENEQMGVSFEKDYIVVRTQNEVKFVCWGKAFISLWRI